MSAPDKIDLSVNKKSAFQHRFADSPYRPAYQNHRNAGLKIKKFLLTKPLQRHTITMKNLNSYLRGGVRFPTGGKAFYFLLRRRARERKLILVHPKADGIVRMKEDGEQKCVYTSRDCLSRDFFVPLPMQNTGKIA